MDNMYDMFLTAKGAEKLESSGLAERINVSRMQIGYFYDVSDRAKEYSEKKDGFVLDEEDRIKRMVELKYEDGDDIFYTKELIAVDVLGTGVNPEDYGFESFEEMDSCVAAYAAEKYKLKTLNEGRSWVRIKDSIRLVNHIRNDVHGDAYLFQYRVEDDGLVAKPEIQGIKAHYDFWKHILITFLKYAEHLEKKDDHLIINWPSFVNADFNAAWDRWTLKGFKSTENTFYLKRTLNDCLLGQDELFPEGEKFPLSIERSYYPLIDGDNLIICDEVKEGEDRVVKVAKKEFKLKDKVTYYPEDLEHTLLATYASFAREYSALVEIMSYFQNPDFMKKAK
jgi:hypothetical protein